MKSIFKRCFSLIIVFVLMLSSNTTINLVAIGISNHDAISCADKNEKESTEDNKKVLERFLQLITTLKIRRIYGK